MVKRAQLESRQRRAVCSCFPSCRQAEAVCVLLRRHHGLSFAPRIACLKVTRRKRKERLTDKACRRDRPNTTHAGLPLRHSTQSDSASNTRVQHVAPGPFGCRPGGVVATMHMSGGQDTWRATGVASNDNCRAAPAGISERDLKRQRSGETNGVVQIQTEEGDFASACFAEDVIAGVLENDAEW